jgi:hypothetical protein
MPPAEHLTAKIQELLDQKLFELTRSMAETLHNLHSTVMKYLHDNLHFRSFYLDGVWKVLPERIYQDSLTSTLHKKSSNKVS